MSMRERLANLMPPPPSSSLIGSQQQKFELPGHIFVGSAELNQAEITLKRACLLSVGAESVLNNSESE
jgi:hypothetical protein